jgi:hypothetical protein
MSDLDSSLPGDGGDLDTLEERLVFARHRDGEGRMKGKSSKLGK